MYKEFKTALTRSGNIINPDVIIVTDDYVKWQKRNSYLIGKDSKTIPINKIASIYIHNKGFGTDVTISSNGAGIIQAKDLTVSDAKELKSLIEGLPKFKGNNTDNQYYNESDANETETIHHKKTEAETKKQPDAEIVNEAIKEELELELKFKKKDLEREERKKQQAELEEKLKSKNQFIHSLKWIWIVLLNKAWKKAVFFICFLLLASRVYNISMDKINLRADTEKINKEVSRLEEVKSKIDKDIESNNFNEADILLTDLVFRLDGVDNRYLKERASDEMTKWRDINLKYAFRISELQIAPKKKSKKTKNKL